MRTRLFAAALLSAALLPVAAQTTVTPTMPQGWVFADGKGGGDAAAITGTNPYNGTGSIQFTITNNAQQPDAYYYFDPASYVQLSSLATVGGSFGYSFFADANQPTTPTFRLLLAGLANTGGSQYGSLGYYGVTGPTWQTANLNADVGDFFFRVVGKGQVANDCRNDSYTQSFDVRNTIDNIIDVTCSNNGGNQIDISNAVIYGVQVDYGSFTFPGSTSVFADDVNFNLPNVSNDHTTGEYNFELDDVTATPEPATISLVAAGLLGVAGFARRRKRSV